MGYHINGLNYMSSRSGIEATRENQRLAGSQKVRRNDALYIY